MKCWTKEEDRFIAENLGCSRKYIAENLRRTVPSVSNRISLGLYIHKEKPEVVVHKESDTPERRELFKKMMYMVKVQSAGLHEKANINWFKFRKAFNRIEIMQEKMRYEN